MDCNTKEAITNVAVCVTIAFFLLNLKSCFYDLKYGPSYVDEVVEAVVTHKQEEGPDVN